MTTRTRFFVIASLLVLTVGLGTGMVAYYVGLPGGASGQLEELQFVPKGAAVVAYANVRDVMASGLRQRIRQAMPQQENGQQEFENQTGIHVETDIDRVVACLDPQGAEGTQPNGLVLARGRFNEVQIEALMREHGAHVEDYKGKRIIVSPQAEADSKHPDFAVTFIEPGLAAVGSLRLVRTAIDLQNGGENVTANEELMSLMPSVNGANAWAVGRFDVLRSSAKLPDAVAQQIPAITLFSVSGQVDAGITGVVRAEARDEEAANTLRDVVRGFMALAKLQVGSNPRLESVVQSLVLGGSGKAVALSFSVPGEAFDGLRMPQPRPRRDQQRAH